MPVEAIGYDPEKVSASLLEDLKPFMPEGAEGEKAQLGALLKLNEKVGLEKKDVRLKDKLNAAREKADQHARYKALIADVHTRTDHEGKVQTLRHETALAIGNLSFEENLGKVFNASNALTLLSVALNHFTGVDFGQLVTRVPGADEFKWGPNLEGFSSVSTSADVAKNKAAESAVHLLEVPETVVDDKIAKILEDRHVSKHQGKLSGEMMVGLTSATARTLQKALWHIEEARRHVKDLKAIKSGGGRRWDVKNCDDAAMLALYGCRLYHEYYKAKLYASPLFPFLKYMSGVITDWSKRWGGIPETFPTRLARELEGTGIRLHGDSAAAEPGPSKPSADALKNLDKVFDFIDKGDHKGCKDICYGPKGNEAEKPLNPLGGIIDVRGSEYFKLPKAKEEEEKIAAAVKKVGDKQKEKLLNALTAQLPGLWAELGGVEAGDDNQLLEAVAFDGKADLKRFCEFVLRSKKKPKEIGLDCYVPTKWPDLNDHLSPEGKRELLNGPYSWGVVKMLRNDHRLDPYKDLDFGFYPNWKKLVGEKDEDIRAAKLFYHVYGLVENKGWTEKLSEWRKRKSKNIDWGLVKVGFVTTVGGIVLTVATGGAALAPLMLIGVAAGKLVVRKAASSYFAGKAVKADTKALDKDDPTNAGNLEPSERRFQRIIPSLTRHALSASKNYQRLLELEPLRKKGFENCRQAAAYAYAAEAFEHHFRKFVNHVQIGGSLALLLLNKIAKVEEYWKKEAEGLFTAVEDQVRKSAAGHAASCGGPFIAAQAPPQQLAVPRDGVGVASTPLPSWLCYGPHKARGARGVFYLADDGEMKHDGVVVSSDAVARPIDIVEDSILASRSFDTLKSHARALAGSGLVKQSDHIRLESKDEWKKWMEKTIKDRLEAYEARKERKKAAAKKNDAMPESAEVAFHPDEPPADLVIHPEPADKPAAQQARKA